VAQKDESGQRGMVFSPYFMAFYAGSSNRPTFSINLKQGPSSQFSNRFAMKQA
jgi:hypothetical protein